MKHHPSKIKFTLKHSHLSNGRISLMSLRRHICLCLGVIPSHPSSGVPSRRNLLLHAIPGNLDTLVATTTSDIFISFMPIKNKLCLCHPVIITVILILLVWRMGFGVTGSGICRCDAGGSRLCPVRFWKPVVSYHIQI
jgi:hypothetical protein